MSRRPEKLVEIEEGERATKVMLANDAARNQEVTAVELDIQELTRQFSDVKDGIYYGCVFAKAKSAGLVAAKNNGIRIVVGTAGLHRWQIHCQRHRHERSRRKCHQDTHHHGRYNHSDSASIPGGVSL